MHGQNETKDYCVNIWKDYIDDKYLVKKVGSNILAQPYPRNSRNSNKDVQGKCAKKRWKSDNLKQVNSLIIFQEVVIFYYGSSA